MIYQVLAQISYRILWSYMDYFFQSLLNHLLKLLLNELTNTHLFLQFSQLLYLCLAFGFIIEFIHRYLQCRLFLLGFWLLFLIKRGLYFGSLLCNFLFIGNGSYLFVLQITLLFTFHYSNYFYSLMNQNEMEEIYKMVDNIPFSRPKKNINRDFSDAVMLAQLIYHYNPKIVSLHNYPPANSTSKKIQNWNTLNLKVLKKLNLSLDKQQIQQISNCVPGVIQQYLYQVFLRFQRPQEQGKLVNYARMMDSKKSRMVNEEQEEQPSNKQNLPYARKNNINVSSQAEEIIKLVEQIDQATQRLNKVREMSKMKDQIIGNLQKKLQKVIFG